MCTTWQTWVYPAAISENITAYEKRTRSFMLINNLMHFFTYLFIHFISLHVSSIKCSSSGDRIVLIYHLVCREMKWINKYMKKCIRLVINMNLWQDARSTKYRTRSCVIVYRAPTVTRCFVRASCSRKWCTVWTIALWWKYISHSPQLQRKCFSFLKLRKKRSKN